MNVSLKFPYVSFTFLLCRQGARGSGEEHLGEVEVDPSVTSDLSDFFHFAKKIVDKTDNRCNQTCYNGAIWFADLLQWLPTHMDLLWSPHSNQINPPASSSHLWDLPTKAPEQSDTTPRTSPWMLGLNLKDVIMSRMEDAFPFGTKQSGKGHNHFQECIINDFLCVASGEYICFNQRVIVLKHSS